MATALDSDFERNVFINCPFDAQFKALLRPLLFTILHFGFNPRIASERSDSAEQRIEKISEFISASKYSIHDLSRLRSSKRNELARHNMPFELGIDYGCRKFGAEAHQGKKFLILEAARYDYSRALSDLGGIDIKSHSNDPEDIIRAVRNWFVETVGITNSKSATTIYLEFTNFMLDFDSKRRAEGFSDRDLFDMPTPEFIAFIKDWLASNPKVNGK